MAAFIGHQPMSNSSLFTLTESEDPFARPPPQVVGKPTPRLLASLAILRRVTSKRTPSCRPISPIPPPRIHSPVPPVPAYPPRLPAKDAHDIFDIPYPVVLGMPPPRNSPTRGQSTMSINPPLSPPSSPSICESVTVRRDFLLRPTTPSSISSGSRSRSGTASSASFTSYSSSPPLSAEGFAHSRTPIQSQEPRNSIDGCLEPFNFQSRSQKKTSRDRTNPTTFATSALGPDPDLVCDEDEAEDDEWWARERMSLKSPRSSSAPRSFR